MTTMWSVGETTSSRSDLRKRGTQSSSFSQKRLLPKVDPFQRCSVCSRSVSSFLQNRTSSEAHAVMLSCAHIVCDACFEKLGASVLDVNNHGSVKCVLCHCMVTFTLLPSLQDTKRLACCNGCAQMADRECLQCSVKLCCKCAEEHNRLSHFIKKALPSSSVFPLPLKYVQCWTHMRRFISRCKLCDQLLCSECPPTSNKENGCLEHIRASLSSSDFDLEDNMLHAERLQEEIAFAMDAARGLRDELCTRANLLKNEICAHIYYMMNAVLSRGFQLLSEVRQEEEAANKQLDDVVSRCSHAQRHLDTACELDERVRDVNLLKDADSADFYKCLSYQLFRPVFTLLKESQKSLPKNSATLLLNVESIKTQDVIDKVGSWGSAITSTCRDLGSEPTTRKLPPLRPEEAWDAKTPPPVIGKNDTLDLHVSPREVPLFFLSAFNNLWMKFILNASKPDSFPVLQPGDCDPIPPCSQTAPNSPHRLSEVQCIPSSSERRVSAAISPRARSLSTGIIVHRILALHSEDPPFRDSKHLLRSHEELFCIGLRLCSKRDVKIKRTQLVKLVGDTLEKIDWETPFYSAKMHYDEYPTHVWNASDMSDVEEIFDALSASSLFHGWPYNKLFPIAMVLYVANFHFNNFCEYFNTRSDIETVSKRKDSEDKSGCFYVENGSPHASSVSQGYGCNEAADGVNSPSRYSPSRQTSFADEKDSSNRRERERLIVKIRRVGHSTPSVSQPETPPALQQDHEAHISVSIGERQLDKDGSHAFCWTCNDNPGSEEEVKGMCSKCPRVFHAKCHIPPIAGSWDDTPDDWVCSICEDVRNDGSASSELKLCFKVLLCCYEHAECASCFAQPVPANTPGYYKVIENPMDLGTVALQLQSPSHIMPVHEFIEKMNTIFRNCSRFNPRSSPVAEAGRKVWYSYQSAVKKYLPSYTKDIWLYVSLHDRKVSLQKRRKKPLCKIDLKAPKLSTV